MATTTLFTNETADGYSAGTHTTSDTGLELTVTGNPMGKARVVAEQENGGIWTVIRELELTSGIGSISADIATGVQVRLYLTGTTLDPKETPSVTATLTDVSGGGGGGGGPATDATARAQIAAVQATVNAMTTKDTAQDADLTALNASQGAQDTLIAAKVDQATVDAINADRNSDEFVKSATKTGNDWTVVYENVGTGATRTETVNDPSTGGTTDAVPTTASTNPVQSGGVFDALALKADSSALTAKADQTALDAEIAATDGEQTTQDNRLDALEASTHDGAAQDTAIALKADQADLDTEIAATDAEQTTQDGRLDALELATHDGPTQDAAIALKADQTALDAEIASTDAEQTAQNDDIALRELIANKVTALLATSTDVEYPSAKAVYDALQALPTNFLANTDTINAFTGLTLQVLRVNAAENAVEAIALAASLVAFDNATAALPGNPATEQAAIEALKSLIDNQPTQTPVNTFGDLPAPGTVPNASLYHVSDASGDPTVTTGWSKYQALGGAWEKHLAQEDLNVAALTLAEMIQKAGEAEYDAAKTGTMTVAGLDAFTQSRKGVSANFLPSDPDHEVAKPWAAVDVDERISHHDRYQTAANGSTLLPWFHYKGTTETWILPDETTLVSDVLVGGPATPLLKDGDQIRVRNTSVLLATPAGALGDITLAGPFRSLTAVDTAGFKLPAGMDFRVVWRADINRWTFSALDTFSVTLLNIHSGMHLRPGVEYIVQASVAGMEFFLPETTLGHIDIRLANGSLFDVTIKQHPATAVQVVRDEQNTVDDHVVLPFQYQGQKTEIRGDLPQNRWHVYRPWELDSVSNDKPRWAPTKPYVADTSQVIQERLSDGVLGIWHRIAAPSQTSSRATWDAAEEADWTFLGAANVSLRSLNEITLTLASSGASYKQMTGTKFTTIADDDYNPVYWKITSDSANPTNVGQRVDQVNLATVTGRTVTIGYFGPVKIRGLKTIEATYHPSSSSLMWTMLATFDDGTSETHTQNGGLIATASTTLNSPDGWDFFTIPSDPEAALTDQAAEFVPDQEYAIGDKFSWPEQDPADDNTGEWFNWHVNTAIAVSEFSQFDGTNFAAVKAKVDRFGVKSISSDARIPLPGDKKPLAYRYYEITTAETLDGSDVVAAGEESYYFDLAPNTALTVPGIAIPIQHSGPNNETIHLAPHPTNAGEFVVKNRNASDANLEIVRYTADGAIQDKDHRAIFESGAVNMTLAASTENRLIQMVSEGPATVITANGAEEFTSSGGTSTDQKLTINETFKWATIIGRTAGGWSQYIGQVGLPDGVASQQQIGDALIEDRGIFREIHGRFSGTGSGTHAFPDGGFGAGFDPIVSGTSMNNGNNIDVGSTSPTEFTYRQWDVETSQQGGDIMYVAKGLKP